MADASILHEPMARNALLRGAKLMSETLRPTIGPVAGTVAISPLSRTSPPEILSHGATIAQRMIALDDRFENMGAMVIRDLVGQVHEVAGDGTATAAVLAQSLLETAVKYSAAGGDFVAIKRGMYRALAEAKEQLRRQARNVDSREELMRLVTHVVGCQTLAPMIAEVLDAVGPSGTVLFKDAQRVETTHEYLVGMRWNEGCVSSLLLDAATLTGQAVDPRILVTDQVLQDARQLVPVVDRCVRGGIRSLVVIAPDIRNSALGLLVINNERNVLEAVLAVTAPSRGRQQLAALEDIAAITGAHCFRQQLGEDPRTARPEQLGVARQVWATRTAAGIVGGRGEKGIIQQRLNAAESELRAAHDEDSRTKIRERIGHLTGLAAVIRVGGRTKNQQADQRLRIESAVKSARLAMQGGVVPGAGAAFLACVPAINALQLSGDEAHGAQMLGHALLQPARTILQNAGLDPSAMLAQAERREPSYTYDVLRQQWVDAWDGGIIDALPVVLAALEASVSAVSTLMITDVLIRRKNQYGVAVAPPARGRR